jgi:hypothetical protein
MANATVVGIFDSPTDAEKVKDELLEAGVARHRIVVSRFGAEKAGTPEETADSEWIGSIVGKIPESEKFDEAVRGASCVVAVVARSHLDKQQIAELMLRHGARGTVEARA